MVKPMTTNQEGNANQISTLERTQIKLILKNPESGC